MENNQVEKTVYTHPREDELGTLTYKVRFLGCQVKPDTNNRIFKVHMVQLTKYRESHNSGYSLLEAEVYASNRPDVFIPFGTEVDAVFLNVPLGQKPVFIRFDGLEKFEPVIQSAEPIKEPVKK